jgi:hypothetical protein
LDLLQLFVIQKLHNFSATIINQTCSQEGLAST